MEGWIRVFLTPFVSCVLVSRDTLRICISSGQEILSTPLCLYCISDGTLGKSYDCCSLLCGRVLGVYSRESGLINDKRFRTILSDTLLGKW